MRWFKHETDAYQNMKLQSVIEKFGLQGYGYYWACVELVAKAGENYRISAKKEWKSHFRKFLNVEVEMQDTFLSHFAEVNLIDVKALTKGDLSIPKLAERCDEYTEKIRRKSRQSTDSVSLEENRIETDIEEDKEEKKTHGEFGKVKLTDLELSKLKEKFGEEVALEKIDELDIALASKNYKFKSHYATILSWDRRKQKESLGGRKIVKELKL